MTLRIRVADILFPPARCDYTPYEGMELLDWPLKTILRGKVVYDGETNEVLAQPGYGQWLKRGKSLLQGPRNRWLSEWRPLYEEERKQQE
jgi:dihydropyrimidinase